MHRRRFLDLTVGGTALLAGCTDWLDQESHTARQSSTTERTTTVDQPSDTRRTLHVAATDGEPGGPGTSESPYSSIQQALKRARPGDTVQVDSGEYREHLSFPRAGTPDQPITVTGPPDAILRTPTDYHLIEIARSHVHLTGLTLTGLKDPDRPSDSEAYNDGGLVFCRPPTDTDQYLTDIVLKPHRIGNSASTLISVMRTQNASIRSSNGQRHRTTAYSPTTLGSRKRCPTYPTALPTSVRVQDQAI